MAATPTARPTAKGSEPGPEARVRGALAVLAPLQPLLAGFNHRNRNQHRGARWWGAFGMLRRGAGRLVGLLEREERAGARSRGKKRRRKGGDEDGDAAAAATAMAATTEAEAMAAWARDVLVPRCYVAFSQLAADNQFATLGIVLLGVLASVRAACVGLVGEPQPPAQGDEALARGAAPPTVPHGGPVDLGEVVSREEVAAAGASGAVADEPTQTLPQKRRKKEQQRVSAAASPAAGAEPRSKAGGGTWRADQDTGAAQTGAEGSPPAKRKRQQRKQMEDSDDENDFFAGGSQKEARDITATITGKSSTGPGKKELESLPGNSGSVKASKRSKGEDERDKRPSSDKVPEEKAKKKRKKKKGADEFDALFSSLV